MLLHGLMFDIYEVPELYYPGFGVFIESDAQLTQEHMRWILTEINNCRMGLYKEALATTEISKPKPKIKRAIKRKR